MTLVVVGVSHKTAGVELRGKLAVPADRLRADLSRLLANDEVSEAACDLGVLERLRAGERLDAEAVYAEALRAARAGAGDGR